MEPITSIEMSSIFLLLLLLQACRDMVPLERLAVNYTLVISLVGWLKPVTSSSAAAAAGLQRHGPSGEVGGPHA